MKKLLVALAAVLVTAATYGQGTVDFNNYTQAGGAGAPIWDVGSTGTKGPGAGVTAGLFVNGTLAGTTDFATQAGFEYLLNPVGITVANIVGGTTVNFEVKAWATTFGTAQNSYDLAVAAGGKNGTSGVFSGVLGGAGNPPGPASNLDNLASFTLVPEPSTIALGVIGGLALLLRRRK